MPSLFILAVIAIIIIWFLLKPLYSTIGEKAKNTYKEFKNNLKEENNDE